jgi:hypothetical protein
VRAALTAEMFGMGAGPPGPPGPAAKRPNSGCNDPVGDPQRAGAMASVFRVDMDTLASGCITPTSSSSAASACAMGE